MDPSELITKRLIISGLTPPLTLPDVTNRLSTFGVTVTSTSGLNNALDAVGQPRKFGFVTVEGTKAAVARSVASLSGSTWKGSKLRVGEARPDFRERIALENVQLLSPPPEKRRRVRAGVNAHDMSLVTPSSAASRSGWKVTPSGRVVYSVRMRPARPLHTQGEDDDRAGKTKQGKGKKRIRARAPPVRARRKTIDVVRYGSVYLKGVFLSGDAEVHLRTEVPPQETDETETDEDVTGGNIREQEHLANTADERKHNLAVLAAIFGNASKESVGSTVEHETEMDGNMDVDQLEPAPAPSPPQKPTSLKDLFAPRDEEAGFSLVDHLGVDLELEDDLPFAISTDTPSSTIPIPVSTMVPNTSHAHAYPQLNPKTPLFFPHLPSSSTQPGKRNGPKDLFDIAWERGWHWRDPNAAFYRTESEEEIRKRWEETKGELTREWKKRWKEAGKLARRGGRRNGGEDSHI